MDAQTNPAIAAIDASGIEYRVVEYGEVTTVEVASNPSLDQTFGGKWLTDVDFSYRFQNGMKVNVGGNNIFDVFPDENRPEISFNGIFRYPRRTAPFGYNGGFWYTRLGVSF